MKRMQVYHYDAFTKHAGKGNPAGIIFNGDQFSEDEMQSIAQTVGFNECGYICQSQKADMRLRYFTPGHEMNLCGHGTVAAITAMMEKESKTGIINLTVETLAGIIEVVYNSENHEVVMTQADAQFMEFSGSRKELMNSIGLTEEDLDDRYPIMYGSTGIWTLIVPIKHLNSFAKMNPNNSKFPEILKENVHSSVHPITLETIDEKNHLHGRHFSSYYSGTVEDPVTGTASGVMSAYYINYIKNMDYIDMYIEQGYEIGKEGLVHAWAEKVNSKTKVTIAGNAVKVKEFEVTI